MNQRQAQVIITHHPLPLDKFYRTYEWQGNPFGEVIVAAELMAEMPWKMVATRDCEVVRDSVWACRSDGKYFWNPIRWRAAEILARFGRGLKVRIIMTLHIWGIGQTLPGEMWQWRNLLNPSPFRRW